MRSTYRVPRFHKADRVRAQKARERLQKRYNPKSRKPRKLSKRSRKGHSNKESSQSEEPKHAFSFLSLPSEIRNHIYGFALARPNRLYLDTLKAPTLAAVSKQIRGECLPVFLEVNAFHTYVCSKEDEGYIWFADHTVSWLHAVSFFKPLIKDISYNFQLPIRDRWAHLNAAVFCIKAGNIDGRKMRHDIAKCIYCRADVQKAETGIKRTPIPIDHPMLRKDMSAMLEITEKTHDAMLDILNKHIVPKLGPKGLSIAEVLDLGDPLTLDFSIDALIYPHVFPYIQMWMTKYDTARTPQEKARIKVEFSVEANALDQLLWPPDAVNETDEDDEDDETDEDYQEP